MLLREGETVAVFVFAFVGLALSAYGFVVMRDPMKLALFNPGAEGYFQRVALDGSTRIPMRVLGALICVFGLMLLSTALSGLVKRPAMEAITDGFLILLWLMFIGAWAYGIVDLVRGRGLNAFELWHRAWKLGPVNYSPSITPTMAKESRAFTLGLSILVAITIAAALFKTFR